MNAFTAFAARTIPRIRASSRAYRRIVARGLTLLVLVVTVAVTSSRAQSEDFAVAVRSVPEQHRVEIRLNGRLFTEYRYGPDFPQKPVFYPVLTQRGTPVNRAYPMDASVDGESHDHPHQQSLFFAYGDVNGVDFWSSRNGRIVHRVVLRAQDGTPGRLEVELDWVGPDDKVLLRETRSVSFGGSEGLSWMDHDIRLTALAQPVLFADTKEGMFALRVAAGLREQGGTGRYLNAFGWETEPEIWGKRAPWVALAGTLEGRPVTVAIFDHPSTENYPSYWHARAYGLFSANPFGRKDFVKGAEPLNRLLAAGRSFHFRYRLMIYESGVTKRRLDSDYWDYVN